jgi:hypothetical protein
MRIFNGKLSGTVSGGTFSGNVTHLNCLVHNIIVAPETSTTEYDFQIINPDGNVIYERTDEVGTLSELIQLPMLGNYTLKILNATVDEDFSFTLVARED